MVQCLLSANADVNAGPLRLGDRTPLQAAAEGGHLTVMECLSAAGANVNAIDLRGRTVLDMATAGGHYDVANLLRAAGA